MCKVGKFLTIRLHGSGRLGFEASEIMGNINMFVGMSPRKEDPGKVVEFLKTCCKL